MRYHFLIVSNGRSGTHLLASLLNSHPHVACEGEFAKEDKLIDEGKLLGEYRGCILPYNQAALLRPLRPLKVIHLTRNPRENAISSEKNRIRYLIRRNGGKPPREPELTEAQICGRALKIRNQQRKFRKHLKRYDCLEVTYEQLTDGGKDIRAITEELSGAICSHLEIKPWPLTTTLEKRK